jgi:hypothetical protein
MLPDLILVSGDVQVSSAHGMVNTQARSNPGETGIREFILDERQPLHLDREARFGLKLPVR